MLFIYPTQSETCRIRSISEITAHAKADCPDQSASLPSPCNMASHDMMMNVLKSVSEGVLKVLTMLLQIMMNYMEEGDQEGVEAKREQMASELQTQRTSQAPSPSARLTTGSTTLPGQGSHANRPPAVLSMPMERTDPINHG